MDKIRFATGTAHVWQGYDDGVTSMAGTQPLVTADTLRDWIAHIYAEVNTSDFDRTWNRLDSEESALAFGEADALAPDGKTPLYRINTFYATIVQRWNPDAGRYGAWENVDAIDAEVGGWDPTTPLTYHGFNISPEAVAEGRSDAPLIRFEADEDEGIDFDPTKELHSEPEPQPWETDPERLARKRMAHSLVEAWRSVERRLDRGVEPSVGDDIHAMRNALDAIIADYVPGYNAESSPEPGQGEDFGPNGEVFDADTEPEPEWYGYVVQLRDNWRAIGAFPTEAERDASMVETTQAHARAGVLPVTAIRGIVPSADSAEEAIEAIGRGDWLIRNTESAVPA